MQIAEYVKRIKKYTREQVAYMAVRPPQYADIKLPVPITAKTVKERRKNVLARMQKFHVDVLFIYADREHGANFSYLTGFEPRFEEAVLVLHIDGTAYLMLGNEMLSMEQFCRIPARAIHVPHFSLPNQPMLQEKKMEEYLEKAGIKKGMQVGVVGWKLFTCIFTENEQIYDVPHFLIDALERKVTSQGSLRNLTKLFIDPCNGVRVTVNANELAYYEFGAAVASDCVMTCLEQIEVGKTELTLAEPLAAYGQPVNVQTICATGERFTDGVIAPRNKPTVRGDRFSVTMGLRGGLTSRAAYVANGTDDLPVSERGYFEYGAKPYFAALATWYATIGLDITAGELYDAIESVLPKEQYGWMLNPGHLTSSEEWLSSPFFAGSDIRLTSGMMLQADIIPRASAFGRAGAEDGIALADKELRDQLKEQYPQVWDRICRRRTYMQEVLGISLKEEVLPLSDLAGYYRPFLLNKQFAFKMEEKV